MNETHPSTAVGSCQCMRSPRNWVASPVRHPGEDVEGSADDDEVILLYIEVFLIR